MTTDTTQTDTTPLRYHLLEVLCWLCNTLSIGYPRILICKNTVLPSGYPRVYVCHPFLCLCGLALN